MSSSDTSRRDPKREARERRAAEVRARAEAARKREARIRIGAAVAVVLVVVGAVVGIALAKSRGSSAYGPLPKGASAAHGGGIVTGSGPATMDIYYDYQCPSCKLLENSVGSKIEQLASQGKVTVVYHPLSFLDTNLAQPNAAAHTSGSSARTANAAGCAADAGVFPQFHLLVYKNQPAQEGKGFTDAQLKQFAASAGAKDANAFASCMASKKYAKWVSKVQLNGENAGVNQTPTVMINGRTVDLANEFTTKDAQGNIAYDPAKVQAVILAAAKK